MAEVNQIAELIERHSKDELISHMARLMNGVSKNYKLAQQSGRSDALWASLGDIMQVRAILIALDKQRREAVAASEDI